MPITISAAGPSVRGRKNLAIAIGLGSCFAARLPMGNIYGCGTVNDRRCGRTRLPAASHQNSAYNRGEFMKPIRKAIFPVAGLGTRFLPATKAMPKEMLPVVDRPLIQHVVDEARAAGIEHFVFVTGRNKGVIEDHFDRQYELERTLAERGKKAELEQLLAELPQPGQTSFTRQQAPLGLGHAVWCAREIVGEEPFALLLPDMLHFAPKPCLADMIEAYQAHGGNHIAVSPVPEDQTHLYGI